MFFPDEDHVGLEDAAGLTEKVSASFLTSVVLSHEG